MNKGGLVFKKQEMTRLWDDNKQVPVTLLKLLKQEVIRKKTNEKDGYSALVVGIGKKELDKEKWNKIKYKYITEFKVDAKDLDNYKEGDLLDKSILESVESVKLQWKSKWKWFAGVVKKYWFGWGPKTHGSKFHRGPGSIGNMNPKRVNKGHPLPGRMWTDKKTLKNVKVIDLIENDNEVLLAVKWSVPGSYGSYVKVLS